MIKYKLYKTGFLLLALIAPQSALAQVVLPDEIRPEYLPDIGRGKTAEQKVYAVAGDVILTAMQIVGGLAVIFLIIAGIRYALSLGEDDKITKAKTAMVWVIGGLILMFLALAIIRFVVKVSLVTEEI